MSRVLAYFKYVELFSGQCCDDALRRRTVHLIHVGTGSSLIIGIVGQVYARLYDSMIKNSPLHNLRA